MRQTDLVRRRLVEGSKARIRKRLHTGNRKDLRFESLIEHLSLGPIVPGCIHIEGYGKRLMNLESRIHALNQTGHPAEDDSRAYQDKT